MTAVTVSINLASDVRRYRAIPVCDHNLRNIIDRRLSPTAQFAHSDHSDRFSALFMSTGPLQSIRKAMRHVRGISGPSRTLLGRLQGAELFFRIVLDTQNNRQYVKNCWNHGN